MKLKIYNYIGIDPKDKKTEAKRKRTLSDKCYKYSNDKGYDYYPFSSLNGLNIHLLLDNKLGEKFIVIAEDKKMVETLKGEYTFVETDKFLKGKTK